MPEREDGIAPTFIDLTLTGTKNYLDESKSCVVVDWCTGFMFSARLSMQLRAESAALSDTEKTSHLLNTLILVIMMTDLTRLSSSLSV